MPCAHGPQPRVSDARCFNAPCPETNHTYKWRIFRRGYAQYERVWSRDIPSEKSSSPGKVTHYSAINVADGLAIMYRADLFFWLDVHYGGGKIMGVLPGVVIHYGGSKVY